MDRLFLLDAYALIYRAYYAFINNPRINSTGMNTSAIFGFVNTLEDILKNEKPTHIGVSFDTGTKTFRHEIFSEYKGTRPPTPEDIRIAIPWIKKLLTAYKIPILILDKYEADDVIGTLAKKFANEKLSVYMMTPDKDYKQLLDDNIFIYKPGRSGNKVEIIDKKILQEEYNIEKPIQIIDILALWGDSADNVPGVPGIGEKTASKLIAEYKSIENIYSNIEQIKGKIKDSLLEYRDQVFLSKKLVTIDINVDIPCNFEDLQIQEPDSDTLIELFTVLEFNNLKARYSFNKNELRVSTIVDVKKNNSIKNKNIYTSKQLDLFSSIGIEIEEIKPSNKSIEKKQEETYDFSSENVLYHLIDARELNIE